MIISLSFFLCNDSSQGKGAHSIWEYEIESKLLRITQVYKNKPNGRITVWRPFDLLTVSTTGNDTDMKYFFFSPMPIKMRKIWIIFIDIYKQFFTWKINWFRIKKKVKVENEVVLIFFFNFWLRLVCWLSGNVSGVKNFLNENASFITKIAMARKPHGHSTNVQRWVRWTSTVQRGKRISRWGEKRWGEGGVNGPQPPSMKQWFSIGRCHVLCNMQLFLAQSLF